MTEYELVGRQMVEQNWKSEDNKEEGRIFTLVSNPKNPSYGVRVSGAEYNGGGDGDGRRAHARLDL